MGGASVACGNVLSDSHMWRTLVAYHRDREIAALINDTPSFALDESPLLRQMEAALREELHLKLLGYVTV